MNKLNELIQACQQAHSEFMAWHEAEKRLLSCVSGQRLEELKQEILTQRELRRTLIAQGGAGGKEYRQLVASITALEGELSDLTMVAEELEQGAYARSCVGQDLWRKHRDQRAALFRYHSDHMIAQGQQELEEALAPVLPLLTRQIARLQDRVESDEYLLDRSVKDVRADLKRFEILEPVVISPIDAVLSNLKALLKPIAQNANPEFDLLAEAEIKRTPPPTLIRLDLVGSVSIRKKNHPSSPKPAPRPLSNVEQRERDNWSPDAMLTRSKNVRDA